MSTPQLRVVTFNPSNLGPYHLARFNRLVDEGIDVTVVACPVEEHPRPWSIPEHRRRFEIDAPFGVESHGLASAFRLARAYLARSKPDVALFVGYNSTYVTAGAAAARLLRIPTVLVLIGWKHERPRRLLVELAKRCLCRLLYRHALVPGVRGEEYARFLGIPASAIYRVGNVVDNDHFAAGARATSEPPHFATVARLAPAKNLDRLLDAFDSYRRGGGSWGLKIYGDGPLRDHIATRVAEIRGAELVGWMSYDELPDALGKASAFVLASKIEPWGLAVNEAMAAGLPVIVSETCGCYPELCRVGENGFGFDPGSPRELAAVMEWIATSPATEREAMGMASSTIIANFSLDTWATALRTALSAMVGRTA